MVNTRSTQRNRKWALDKLREHPRQRELFPDLPDQELEKLAADMDANGLQHPVEILPDGVIVAGHQRVRAARLLGWREIDVIVHHDLAAEGDAAVEAYLVRDNMLRRQLSPLARARCIQAMVKIDHGGVGRTLGWQAMDQLKEALGQQLGMTGRNVNRYLLIMRAPIEVQEAFDRGELTLTNAGRVALLYARKQLAVAERIQQGEPAKKVVQEALNKGKSDADSVARPLRRFIGALKREIPLLKDRLDEIEPPTLASCLPLFRDTQRVIQKMVRRGKSHTEPDTVS